MFKELKNKKIRDWCLFDFAISSYQHLLLRLYMERFMQKK